MRGQDRSYSDYLNDIRDATEKAAKFVSGITFEQFLDNGDIKEENEMKYKRVWKTFEKLPIVSFRPKGEILNRLISLRFLVAIISRNDKIQRSLWIYAFVILMLLSWSCGVQPAMATNKAKSISTKELAQTSVDQSNDHRQT